MKVWRWLRRERDDGNNDAAAAVIARQKLDQARRETQWMAQVAAPALARLPTNEFVDRVRAAMTLPKDPKSGGR